MFRWWKRGERIEQALERIEEALRHTRMLLQHNAQHIEHLERMVSQMGPTLDDVKQKVTEQTTVISSAVTLLTDLRTKLDAAIATGNMAKVQEISDALGANTNALADAITANTPSA